MSSRLPGTRPLLRGLVALVAVVGLGSGLAACQVKPGAAAFVGDEKISEQQVTDLLVKDSAAASQAQGQGTQPARPTALSFLVIRDLARDYAAAHDITIDDAAIQSVRTDVLGSDPASALTQANDEASTAGLAPGFVDLRVEVVSLVQLIEKSGVAETDIGAALAQGPAVKLSPRYGTWDRSNLAVTSSTPSYLTLSDATGA